MGVATTTVKPDGYEAYVEVARKSKAIIERCGGKNIRLLAALVAGEATGSLVFIFEADDLAAYGAVGDKFVADPAGQALAASANTSGSPIASQQQTAWVDIPL